MKKVITATTFSSLVFYLLIYINLCSSNAEKQCNESQININSRCIEIEDLISNETLSLNSTELENIYLKYETINTSKYEINIKRLNDKKIQNKKMVDSNIYISEKCINLLSEKIKLDKNAGYIYIVTNKFNSNINGINEYYFIIRHNGQESNIKFINGKSFDFSFCNSDPIILKKSIPIYQIKKYEYSSETNEYQLIDIDRNQILYAKSQDVDLFNIHSDFFNDICFKFTSVNNTDVTLETRNNEYYQNITLCDINLGAFYINYEYDNNTSIFTYKCAYGYFKSEDESNKLLDDINNKMNQIFTTSNIKVITCYNELFNFSNFIHNYGEIICLIVLVIQFIMFFIYLSIGTRPIQKVVDRFLAKKNLNNVNAPKLDKKDSPSNNINIPNLKEKEPKEHSRLNANSREQLNNCASQDEIKAINSKKKVTKLDSQNPVASPPKKDNITNIDEDKINKINMQNSNNSSFHSKDTNIDKINDNNIPKKENYKEIGQFSQNENLNSNNINSEQLTVSDESSNQKKSIRVLLGMINEELNELPFEEAKIHDKRNYCTYYWGILQVSHLFLFTFCHPGDYNLFIVKFGLLLFSIPLNLTIGALFYTTKEMQIVYLNKDTLFKVDLKSLARSILTSIISSIILICLKLLCITHGSIQKLRKIEDVEKAKVKSVQVIKCIKFRICLYYILSLIFLFLFLFYVTCFCAIYPNNQLGILRDMLMSWILTLIYPFGLVIFTSIFRICSLRLDKYCCYFINKILQMF